MLVRKSRSKGGKFFEIFFTGNLFEKKFLNVGAKCVILLSSASWLGVSRHRARSSRTSPFPACHEGPWARRPQRSEAPLQSRCAPMPPPQSRLARHWATGAGLGPRSDQQGHGIHLRPRGGIPTVGHNRVAPFFRILPHEPFYPPPSLALVLTVGVSRGGGGSRRPILCRPFCSSQLDQRVCRSSGIHLRRLVSRVE